jgi:SAM-dependent methyltransferase
LTTLDYSDKAPDYFSHARREIAPLLPARCNRILEVGCGTGATLRWLKALYPQSETVGIEYHPPNRVPLETNADSFYIGDAEIFSKDIGMFDLILFLDVLEHLRSPEDTLRRYVRLMKPGSTVIVSVPAVSYIGVSLPLLLRRRFTYADAGILDRTHTRLFVEDTAVALLNDADLVVDAGLLGGLHGRKARLINAISFGFFRHYLTKQYIVRGSRSPEAKQSAINWRIAKYLIRV